MSINRTEQILGSMGLTSIMVTLMRGPLEQQIEMNFGNLKTAKTVQRYLYKWLSFHPEIKSRTGIKLKEGTGSLIVVNKSIPERRGRRRIP